MLSKQKLVGNLTFGLTFVVSAPAGTGKTTLVGMLTKEFDAVKMSISCTTRPPRPHEIDGVHYHFISEDEFQRKVEAGEFLEHVSLFGHRYGTSATYIEKKKSKGLHVVLVIDTQGAVQLMGKISATFIFLLPPSKEELMRRLVGRGTEKKEVIEERLRRAEVEMELANLYDYQIVNDDLPTAYQVLRSIVIAEEHRVQKS
jgi:guanylate kinase